MTKKIEADPATGSPGLAERRLMLQELPSAQESEKLWRHRNRKEDRLPVAVRRAYAVVQQWDRRQDKKNNRSRAEIWRHVKVARTVILTARRRSDIQKALASFWVWYDRYVGID